jgi:hypothetical protein
MRNFVAIHQHAYGTTIVTFATKSCDAVAIFNELPATDDDCENPEWELTQVDMARDLGLAYEPHLDESVDIHEVEASVSVDLSPYAAQTGLTHPS